jgi:hypothetical protein
MTVETSVAEEALRRFREITNAWLPYIESASIVAVAVKSPEGLNLVSGRVQLFRSDVEHPPDLHVETEHILGRRQFVACAGESAAELVDEVIGGRVAFQNPSSRLGGLIDVALRQRKAGPRPA